MAQQNEAPAFDDVSEYAPAFDNGEYDLTVVRIENAEGGKYGPSLRWIWNMRKVATGEIVLAPDSSGEAYEWHQYSSRRLTPRTKHYAWIRALLGRAPEIGESGVALLQAVLGKSMRSYCAPDPAEPGGRQRIMTADPIPARSQPPAAMSAPAPVEEDDEEALLARLEAARARKGAANRENVGVTDEAYRAIFKDDIPV